MNKKFDDHLRKENAQAQLSIEAEAHDTCCILCDPFSSFYIAGTRLRWIMTIDAEVAVSLVVMKEDFTRREQLISAWGRGATLAVEFGLTSVEPNKPENIRIFTWNVSTKVMPQPDQVSGEHSKGYVITLGVYKIIRIQEQVRFVRRVEKTYCKKSANSVDRTRYL